MAEEKELDGASQEGAEAQSEVELPAEDKWLETSNLQAIETFLRTLSLVVVWEPYYAEMKEEFETAQQTKVFEVADKFAKKYFLEKVIPRLFTDPVLAAKAKAVISTTNFGTVSPHERKAFLELAIQHQAISRQAIIYMLDNPTESGRGFSDIEESELRHGIELADLTDKIYREWEGMQHDIPDAKDRAEKGFTSKWHIVKKDTASGEFKEVPYREIWQNEYRDIDSCLSGLILELELMQRQERSQADKELLASKLNYYKKLATAYRETDPAKLPALWLEADIAFVHQGGNLRAVHPMEEGYAANSTGIIPQQCLRYFMPSPTNETIQERKKFILENFSQLLKGNDQAIEQMQFINKVDARISYYPVRSGLELVFKIAGHNIPNPNEARSQGVHIYLDPNTTKERLEEGVLLFLAFFDNKYLELSTAINPDEALAETATHELGHNINSKFLSTPQSAMIEEWKASATQYVMQTLTPDEWTDEDLTASFMAYLVQAMRYSQRRHEASQKPYYGAWSGYMKAAEEVGLIVPEKEGGVTVEWGLDSTREKLLKLAETIKNQWLELQEIYTAKDEAKLNAFLEKTTGRSLFMDSVDSFTKLTTDKS